MGWCDDPGSAKYNKLIKVFHLVIEQKNYTDQIIFMTSF